MIFSISRFTSLEMDFKNEKQVRYVSCFSYAGFFFFCYCVSMFQERMANLVECRKSPSDELLSGRQIIFVQIWDFV